ncbi:hypothetical protein QZH41_011277, partial [Actinostola sp. cb2023]
DIHSTHKVTRITFIVLQVGFAFLEAGSVRSKNTTNILIKNVLDVFIGGIAFWLFGYAFAYGSEGNSFIGYSYFALSYIPDTVYAHWFFQFVFAATASTIVSGAMAERTEFRSYMVYSVFLTGKEIHLSGGWLALGTTYIDNNVTTTVTYMDFAGSSVVHMLGGGCALVGAILVGARIGRFDQFGDPVVIQGHTVPMSALGGFILFFGFFAFNGGSQGSIASEGDAAIVAQAIVNTILSGTTGYRGGGALTAMIIKRMGFAEKKWSLLITINGALTGMVAICAGASVFKPYCALVVGVVAGAGYILWSWAVLKVKIDDPLDAVAVHFGGGIWGILAAPLLAYDRGVFYKWDRLAFTQLGWNMAGMVSIRSLVYWMCINHVWNHASCKTTTRLDIPKHGEPAYPQASYGHGWNEANEKSPSFLAAVHGLTDPESGNIPSNGINNVQNTSGDVQMTRYRKVPCRAVPCRAVPCRAVPCRAVPCRAVPCRAVPCRAVPCRAVPCRVLAIQHREIPVLTLCRVLLGRSSSVYNTNADWLFKQFLMPSIHKVTRITFIVLQVGFAFLEAGSVRSKNTTNILIKNVLDVFIGGIAFWLFGYAFAYGSEGNSFIGYSYFALSYIPDTVYAHWFFQFVFAATASTIVSGAMAERTEFRSYMVYSVFLTGFIYPVVAHWAWDPKGWLAVGTTFTDNNVTYTVTYMDFAGSSVVHMLGGGCALVGAILVGARIGRFDQFGNPVVIQGHTVPMSALGGFILFFGFFAFNGGSQGSIASEGDAEIVALAIVNTIISGGGGALTAMIIKRMGFAEKKWSLLITINGGLTGMVSICAGASVFKPYCALVVGVVAGAGYILWSWAVLKIKVDDPLDAVAVHFGGGIWGILAAPLLAYDRGVLYKWDRLAFTQLGWNMAGMVSIALWSTGCAFIMFGIMRLAKQLRVDEDIEIKGSLHTRLDIPKHGEPAYPQASYGHGWNEANEKSPSFLAAVHGLTDPESGNIPSNGINNVQNTSGDVQMTRYRIVHLRKYKTYVPSIHKVTRITFIVLQVGFAFLEAGSVRSKNTTNILIKNVLDVFIGGIAFWLFGYAFAYGSEGNSFIGYSYFALSYIPDTVYAHWFFQFVFAATASTIVSGAMAERTEFRSYMVYSVFLTGFIYPVVAHWAWDPKGWLAVGTTFTDNDVTYTVTYMDFAGSSVVHMLGGGCALVGAILVGARIRRFDQFGNPVVIQGHTVPMSALGGFILFFGFFAFNGGSQGSIASEGDAEIVALAIVNTIISGGGGALTAMIIKRMGFAEKKWSLLITINGGLTGMVAICAGASVFKPYCALVVGVVAGAGYILWSWAVLKVKIDDPLDAVAGLYISFL